MAPLPCRTKPVTSHHAAAAQAAVEKQSSPFSVMTIPEWKVIIPMLIWAWAAVYPLSLPASGRVTIYLIWDRGQVAASVTGQQGHVTGLDFTVEMVSKAEENLKKMGYSNIEFIRGDIEEMPLPDNSYDVVISNCVLNLVPDKEKAFSEIMRVLKPGGHFSISDIVLEGILPKKIKEAAEMYAGCVSGALQSDEYLGVIKSAGFTGIRIDNRKEINIPNQILLEYMTMDELREFKRSKTGIFSITVTAEKAS